MKKGDVMAERREIDRRFKWRTGHNPRDDDAHPDSGWTYIDRVEVEKPPPAGPRIKARSGPPAGMKCVRYRSCTAQMYILEDKEPQEILAYLPTPGGDVILPKVGDRVVELICSNGHRAQWKLSMLPSRRGLSEAIEI